MPSATSATGLPRCGVAIVNTAATLSGAWFAAQRASNPPCEWPITHDLLRAGLDERGVDRRDELRAADVGALDRVEARREHVAALRGPQVVDAVEVVERPDLVEAEQAVDEHDRIRAVGRRLDDRRVGRRGIGIGRHRPDGRTTTRNQKQQDGPHRAGIVLT